MTETQQGYIRIIALCLFLYNGIKQATEKDYKMKEKKY